MDEEPFVPEFADLLELAFGAAQDFRLVPEAAWHADLLETKAIPTALCPSR
jgi:hypothetical protein